VFTLPWRRRRGIDADQPHAATGTPRPGAAASRRDLEESPVRPPDAARTGEQFLINDNGLQNTRTKVAYFRHTISFDI